MTDRLRHLAIYVDEPEPGAFRWVLIESTQDASSWRELSASQQTFDQWIDAWDTGCVAMHKMVHDERSGPRIAGEDEDAAPVG